MYDASKDPQNDTDEHRDFTQSAWLVMEDMTQAQADELLEKIKGELFEVRLSDGRLYEFSIEVER